MRIIAFIEDHMVIDKIIKQLKLSFIAERPPSTQVLQHELLLAAEERGEFFWGPLWLLFVDLGEKVYLFADCSAVYVDLSILFAIEHVVLSVTHLLQVVSNQIERKIVRNFGQPTKGYSYLPLKGSN